MKWTGLRSISVAFIPIFVIGMVGLAAWKLGWIPALVVAGLFACVAAVDMASG